ncbi:ATP synthase F1 subunit gamma [Candidatus Kaiserbacteria bacterium RIFCSPLOWO2_12_FULL_53_8]|uniref:ATP synthase gamma chain n=2 Tax=Candidatus Kaiseribacteriota TaxID=1752734 RepID=A0A1F6CY11_9BACT|nr:MAG: ATP synthase F1 subunit gamma [Candidatus Kaiserbacteria bacterium RIFCSPHIGHO2_01_FULL_53_29]OGG92347.1 MAG: ATP synthase F1 subunit gamma [Candidatus Kaiserbacteria bacterium RIFCSPLOWO2_12_FULL_53_8]
MASLKNIKLKILSYKKTGTVTHAMEAVSAVKMRKSQERALSGRSYAAAALSVLERLSGTADVAHHPLMRERAGKTCIIVVTSDKGLAGSLNSGVIRRVEQEIVARKLKREDVVMIGVGRRGADYFANRGYEVREKLENVSDSVVEDEMRMVTDKVVEWHAASEIGAAVIAYTNFVSTFEQEPIVRQIVPIQPETIREIVAGIRPARGKYAPDAEEKIVRPAVYTVEPDPQSVLAVLLPKLLNIAVFHGLLEAKASEHSARRVAMKSATDKAKEMAGDLTRKFNKVRQAAITREVSEITSGIEAMK